MSKPTKQWPCKFLHYRQFDYAGCIMGNGGVTVAYIVTELGVEFAIAKCHAKDRYNKKLGRLKSYGRLTGVKYKEEEPLTQEEFIQAMDSDMADIDVYRPVTVWSFIPYSSHQTL